jgi:hypothetical protein
VRLVPVVQVSFEYESGLGSAQSGPTGPQRVTRLLLCVVDRKRAWSADVHALGRVASDRHGDADVVVSGAINAMQSGMTLCGLELGPRSEIASARGFGCGLSCPACEVQLAACRLVGSVLE